MFAPELPPADGPAPESVRRLQAIEEVRGRFEDKPFELGRNDCLQLARAMLVAMGHRVPKPPKYRSLVAARRALKGQGAANLSELLDKYLEPIVPAAMLPGDIGLVEGTQDEGGETLVVSLGRKVWGWHPDSETLAVIDPEPGAIRRAWRA